MQKSGEHHKLFQKTSERHRKLLQTKPSPSPSFKTDEAQEVLSDYKISLDGLSRELMSSMSKYDLPTLCIASLLMGLVRLK